MFARDENGSVIAYPAQCESEPNLYDGIALNRIDFARGSDGRVTRSEVTTIWRVAVANPVHPVALPEQLPRRS